MELASTIEEEHNQQMHNTTNRQETSHHYFINDNPQLSIQNDAKYHGKTYLLTLALLKSEINNIIEPNINSPEVNGEVKVYLHTKKTELNKFHTNLTTMFANGQLNPTKYLQVISKMKNINTELLQDLSNNATADTHRIRERLRILEAEAEEYTQKANNESMSIETSAVPESMGVSGFFSKIDKLPPQSLAKLIQKRTSQYWNLASFISDQILPNQEPEEQVQTRERLQNYFYPLITKGNQYVKELEEGVKPPEAARFFRKEMLEMSPAVLHGKSLEDRKLDLEKIAAEIEDCIKQEEEYINVLKSSQEDPDQPTGANGKKIKESEKNIAKYNEYIETLSKLSSQKYAWMPTPKVSISKEQRLVSLSNSEIPANALQVEFKRLSNMNKGSYWIRWGIETQDGYRSFETDYCDSKALTFNYKEMVEMTSKLRMEQSLENKEIRVEILYKKFIYFTECKDSEGAIPLSDFRKTNLIQGKLSLNSGAELHYVLKIKQPLTKNTRMEVSTVHAFQLFPVFTKDAPTPTPQTQQVNPRSSRVTVATSSNSQRRPSNPVLGETKSIIIEQENFPVPRPKEIRQPEKMEILAPTVSNEERKVPEKPSNSTGGGLFQKKKYPPLVLLKPDTDPLASLTEDELEGLTLEEAVNPGNPEKIESVTVLKKLAEELEKARSELAGEGRKADNRFVSDNWSKALRKATILEAQFGQGEVDPLDYVAKLKEVIEKDEKLIVLYGRKGDYERMGFVKETMKIMEGEIREIEEALAAESEA